MTTKDNVYYEIVDGKLTIIVDLNTDLGVSSTGKSKTIASTGFVNLDDGVFFKLNVGQTFAPRKAKQS